jgi:hypothetical protein
VQLTAKLAEKENPAAIVRELATGPSFLGKAKLS